MQHNEPYKSLIGGLQKLRGQMITERAYAQKEGPIEAVPFIQAYLNKLNSLIEPFDEDNL